MYINFQKARYWVQASCLPAYLLWRLREARNSQQMVREMFRSVWAPAWYQSLEAELINIEKRSSELGVQIGWVRFPTDGTRIQVFDHRGDRICKVSRKNAPFSTVEKELDVRTRISNLAPAILKISHDKLAFVEEWLPGHSAPYSIDNLKEVIEKLQKYLYKIDYVAPELYRNLLCTYGMLTEREERILDFALSAFPGRFLPISQVHGDLVCKNIWCSLKGELILLDWEYTRKCLVTYDCWLYLYDYYRRTDHYNPLPGDFFHLLSATFRQLGFNLSSKDTKLHHLLHLIERCTFLNYLIPKNTAFLRQVMEKDMDQVVK